MRVPTWVRENGLGITFGLGFLLALGGQAAFGVVQENQELVEAGLPEISFWTYITSSSFAVDVTENWQSEFLQFFLFVTATVWLVQRGSPESKPLDKRGRESDKDQKVGDYAEADSPRGARATGARGWFFARSLSLVMGAIFLGSWLVQSVTGNVTYNEEQVRTGGETVSYLQYLGHPDFWGRTLQNWQSELLAVTAMVVLSIYLRERGSPESKPVGTAHSATAEQG